jgi:hypothetical protein
VLGFPAREAAPILGTTEESVTSALKRARAALKRRQRRPAEREPPRPPGSAAERDLAGRLTRAFAAADVDGIVALLADDVGVTMPPLPLEYQGRDLAGAFLRAVIRPGSGGLVIATRPTASPRLASMSATRTPGCPAPSG